MKTIGQIMEELGFNPKSTPSSKAAFIKYLAKQAYNVDLQVPEIYQSEEESGELTLDSYLARDEEKQSSKVEPIFSSKEKKGSEPKQMELNLSFEDYKCAE